MPVIFIKCPQTGASVSTGLNTDWVEFATLPRVPIPIRCPACGKTHTWTNSTAWVAGARPAPIAAE